MNVNKPRRSDDKHWIGTKRKPLSYELDLEEYIDSLEIKLDQQTQQIEELKRDNYSLHDTNDQQKQVIGQLTQQLEELEAIIANARIAEFFDDIQITISKEDYELLKTKDDEGFEKNETDSN